MLKRVRRIIGLLLGSNGRGKVGLGGIKPKPRPCESFAPKVIDVTTPDMEFGWHKLRSLEVCRHCDFHISEHKNVNLMQRGVIYDPTTNECYATPGGEVVTYNTETAYAGRSAELFWNFSHDVQV